VSARIDCQCGGIVGLFFGRIEVSRVTAPQESPDGRSGLVTEIHYPAHNAIPCGFFFNGREISAGRTLAMFLNNSAPPRPERTTVGYMTHESLTAPCGAAASRAAEAIGRYAEQPDNP
jgi:hypothetical protein